MSGLVVYHRGTVDIHTHVDGTNKNANTLEHVQRHTHTHVHQRRRVQMHVMFREEVTSEYAKKTLPQARDF